MSWLAEGVHCVANCLPITLEMLISKGQWILRMGEACNSLPSCAISCAYGEMLSLANKEPAVLDHRFCRISVPVSELI